MVNVRHRAVDPARRAGLPSVLAETAPVAPDPEPDPGYAAPPSDDGVPTLGIEPLRKKRATRARRGVELFSASGLSAIDGSMAWPLGWRVRARAVFL